MRGELHMRYGLHSYFALVPVSSAAVLVLHTPCFHLRTFTRQSAGRITNEQLPVIPVHHVACPPATLPAANHVTAVIVLLYSILQNIEARFDDMLTKQQATEQQLSEGKFMTFPSSL